MRFSAGCTISTTIVVAIATKPRWATARRRVAETK